jgi:hypothetical protein
MKTYLKSKEYYREKIGKVLGATLEDWPDTMRFEFDRVIAKIANDAKRDIVNIITDYEEPVKEQILIEISKLTFAKEGK